MAQDEDDALQGRDGPPAEAAEARSVARAAVVRPRQASRSGDERIRDEADDDDDDDSDEDDDDFEDDDDDDGPVSFTLKEAAGAFSTVWSFCRPFLPPHRKGLALIGLGLLVETAFNVLMPLSLKVLVDDVFEDEDWNSLVTVLTILGVAGIVVSLVAIWYERIDARVSADIVADIRERLYDHAQKLPSAFHARTRAGEVLSRFSVDMATLEESVINAANWAILPALELTVGVGLLFYLNWQLAAVALLIFPIALIGPRLIAPRAVDASYGLKKREASALAAVQEQLGAISVIKAFSLRGVMGERFRTRNREVALAMRRATFLNTMVERSVTIAVLLLHLIVLGAGAYLTFQGTISLGAFIAFESVFWEISYNLAHMMQFVPVLIESSGAARHMQELLDEPVTIADKPGATVMPRPSDAIVFEAVVFGYGPRRRQLEKLDLRIPVGRRVAIVGPSGAGKTTVLGLLLRLYEPQGGRIAIDGVDIRDVTLDSLRGHMAVVFQDNVLFHGTIADNIRLGNPEASDAEVVAAAKKAEIHRYIRSLPKGYDTIVGERGSTLSGGQRQRIAIARAVIRNPAILLLDEATSALDQTTEAALNRTLHGVAAGRTVVFVTHRLTSVMEMDEIVVMDRGRIVQRGTHAELLATKGLYASLWKAQMKGNAG